MKSSTKSILVAFASVCAGALASWSVMHGISDAESSAEEVPAIRKIASAKKGASVRKITEISLDRKNGRRSVKIVESEISKPVMMNIEAEDGEEKLTDFQRSIVNELQDALDRDDIRSVRKILSRFTASVGRGGLGGNVPKVMRMQAVQALGWFGREAAVDLLDFMADSDEEVASDAFDQFESSLGDSGMGDAERSELLLAALKAINDNERIDNLLSNLNDMRNSRKYETIKGILENGSEAAKTIMRQQLEDYTDSDVHTLDDLNHWVAMNPDDPDDAEFYRGEN